MNNLTRVSCHLQEPFCLQCTCSMARFNTAVLLIR